MKITVHIHRVYIDGKMWYQIDNSDIFVDRSIVLLLMRKGVNVVDVDAVKLEREYQSKWN